MKKIIAVLLALTSLLSIVSCGNEQTDTTTAETTTETQTTETTTEASTSESETTTVHTWNYPAPIAPTPIEDKDVGKIFTSMDEITVQFDGFYKNEQIGSEFTAKASVDLSNLSSLCPLAIFRVVGIEETTNYGYTTYHIQLIDVYDTAEVELPKISIQLEYPGTYENPAWSRPPLAIGEIYGCIYVGDVNELQEDRSFWLNHLLPYLFKVEEQNGTRYLYGQDFVLDNWECKIPITDPEENSIYKKGTDDVIIEYIENQGRKLPTYDYKCELDAFWQEMVNYYE